MIFGLLVYEVLQNIPKTALGWKYIVLFIGNLFFYKDNAYAYILTGGKVPPPYLM